MIRKCKIEGCGRKHWQHDYCRMHFARFDWARKRGKVMNAYPSLLSERHGVVCCVNGCGKKVHSKGYCDLHYNRFRKGKALDSPLYFNQGARKGENNHNWKGGTSLYKDHWKLKLMRIEKLKQADYKCAICHEPATEIHHLDRSKTNHDPLNLLVVCHACHKRTFHRHPYNSKFRKIYGMSAMEISKKLNISNGSVLSKHKKGLLKIPL